MSGWARACSGLAGQVGFEVVREGMSDRFEVVCQVGTGGACLPGRMGSSRSGKSVAEWRELVSQGRVGTGESGLVCNGQAGRTGWAWSGLSDRLDSGEVCQAWLGWV